MDDTADRIRHGAAVVRDAIRALDATPDHELAKQADDPVVLARLLQASALVEAARAARLTATGELRQAYDELLDLAPAYLAGVQRILSLRR